MKTFGRAILLVAALLFVGASQASADSLISYTFSGPITVSFDLAANPVPTVFSIGGAFEVIPVNLMINGAASGDFLVFYNTALGGGFGAFSCGSCTDLSLAGAQLYTGLESSPTMIALAGVTLNDFMTGQPAGTISNTASTPEPSAFLLLAIGLFAVLGTGLVSKRFTPVSVTAS